MNPIGVPGRACRRILARAYRRVLGDEGPTADDPERDSRRFIQDGGSVATVAGVVGFFALLQTAVSLLAIYVEGEDWSLAAYAPLFVVGYKQFLDLVMLRSAADVLLGREVEWTRADRLDGFDVRSERE